MEGQAGIPEDTSGRGCKEQAGSLDAGHRRESIGWEPDRASGAGGDRKERRGEGVRRRSVRLTGELQPPRFQWDRSGNQGEEERVEEGEGELRSEAGGHRAADGLR